MKYKANPSFSKLGRENNHQGLDKPVFDLLKDGETVECVPPEWLVKRRYLKLVEDETDTTDETNASERTE